MDSQREQIDYAEHLYWKAFCPLCGESPCDGGDGIGSCEEIDGH